MQSNYTANSNVAREYVGKFIMSSSQDFDNLTSTLANFAHSISTDPLLADNNITELETIAYNQTTFLNIFNTYYLKHLTNLQELLDLEKQVSRSLRNTLSSMQQCLYFVNILSQLNYKSFLVLSKFMALALTTENLKDNSDLKLILSEFMTLAEEYAKVVSELAQALLEYKKAIEDHYQQAERLISQTKEEIKEHKHFVSKPFEETLDNMKTALTTLQPGPLLYNIKLDFETPLYFQLPNADIYAERKYTPYLNKPLFEIYSEVGGE